MTSGFGEHELLVARVALERGALSLVDLINLAGSINEPRQGDLLRAIRLLAGMTGSTWQEVEREVQRRMEVAQAADGETGETLLAINPTGEESETLCMPTYEIMATEYISQASTVLQPESQPGGQQGAQPPAPPVHQTVVVDSDLDDTPGPAATVIGHNETEDDRAFFHQLQGGTRYTMGREVARGGHGRINVARDEKLGRHIALKRLISGSDATPNQRRKFVLEARVNGLLEHPNIVPVYDLGVMDNLDLYFTMKMVRGRSLKLIVYKQRKDDAKIISEFGRIRMLMIFQQICQAVHYAHAKGIIHRDLKPENIMVGHFGEVLVMDWGLAKIVDVEDLPAFEEAQSILPEDIEKTRVGTISGTPSYMAPEQARGRIDLIDARTDVYSLGAILYEILTHHPPFEGQNVDEILEQVRTRDPVWPLDRSPQNGIPVDLAEICMRAMDKDPQRRYLSAKDLYDDIEQFLEGSKEKERNRAKARQLVEQAKVLFTSYFDFRDQHVMAKKRLDTLLKDGVDGMGGEGLWSAEMERLDTDIALDRVMVMLKDELNEAITLDGGLDEARAMLADVYYTRFREAELKKNKKEMIYNRGHIEELTPERYRELLGGGGTVSFKDHDGAGRWRVLVNCLQNGRMVSLPLPEKSGNVKSVVELPIGNYIVEVTRRDRVLRYPLLLEKGEHAVISLDVPEVPDPPMEGLDLVLVPGSSFIKGGDPGSVGYLKISEPVVGSYAVARAPVTVVQYHEFLHQWASDEKTFLRHAPRLREDGGYLWRVGDDLRRIERRLGWKSQFPIVGISWTDARTFATWLSSLTGESFCLPSDEQWEKAARGVDGRRYPWGNEFNSAWCTMRDSHQGKAGLKPVASAVDDVSPYGVCDMAGGVREWCRDWLNESSGERLVRGGSWHDPEVFCRAASRTGFPADQVSATIGFRVVREFEH